MTLEPRLVGKFTCEVVQFTGIFTSKALLVLTFESDFAV